MYSETSELDKAERGECQELRSPKDETSRQVNGESPQRISQPLHQTQDPVAHAQCDDIGERHFVPSLRSQLTIHSQSRPVGPSGLLKSRIMTAASLSTRGLQLNVPLPSSSGPRVFHS